MLLMISAGSADELSREYRRLARLFHPDKGGSTVQMQQLNREYQQLKERFKKPVRKADLQVGDTVFVNGSECRVVYMERFTFIAKSVVTGRTAVFDRETGLAVGNKKFRARTCG